MTGTASLVPLYESNDVYLVLDELMTFERVWCELSEIGKQTVLELIANGGFNRPMRVVVFNTAEGKSRDDTVAVGSSFCTCAVRVACLEPPPVSWSNRPRDRSRPCWRKGTRLHNTARSFALLELLEEPMVKHMDRDHCRDTVIAIMKQLPNN